MTPPTMRTTVKSPPITPPTTTSVLRPSASSDGVSVCEAIERYY